MSGQPLLHRENRILRSVLPISFSVYWLIPPLYHLLPESPKILRPSCSTSCLSMHWHPEGGEFPYRRSWLPSTYIRGVSNRCLREDKYSGGRSPHEIIRSTPCSGPPDKGASSNFWDTVSETVNIFNSSLFVVNVKDLHLLSAEFISRFKRCFTFSL